MVTLVLILYAAGALTFVLGSRGAYRRALAAMDVRPGSREAWLMMLAVAFWWPVGLAQLALGRGPFDVRERDGQDEVRAPRAAAAAPRSDDPDGPPSAPAVAHYPHVVIRNREANSTPL